MLLSAWSCNPSLQILRGDTLGPRVWVSGFSSSVYLQGSTPTPAVLFGSLCILGQRAEPICHFISACSSWGQQQRRFVGTRPYLSHSISPAVSPEQSLQQSLLNLPSRGATCPISLVTLEQHMPSSLRNPNVWVFRC